jgi:hypothetical protein
MGCVMVNLNHGFQMEGYVHIVITIMVLKLKKLNNE